MPHPPLPTQDTPRTPAIRLDEALPDSMRLMVVAQFDRILFNLGPGQENRDKGVHNARKAMKRIRGLIRLVRDEVGYGAYRTENVVLRDVARILAPVRDGYVQVMTLKKLKHDYRHTLAPNAFAATRSYLTDVHEAARSDVLGDRQLAAQVRVTLGTARNRFAAWDAAGARPSTKLAARAMRDDYEAIAPGILRVYGRGRRGLLNAYEQGSEEAFHEWRKRVKYLRYHMEALEPVWPEMIGAHARALDELGELLGDEHDLAVLGEIISNEPAATSDQRERTLLLALIYRSRLELQWQARPLGRSLFAEEPDQFVARIGAYFEAARLR